MRRRQGLAEVPDTSRAGARPLGFGQQAETEKACGAGPAGTGWHRPDTRLICSLGHTARTPAPSSNIPSNAGPKSEPQLGLGFGVTGKCFFGLLSFLGLGEFWNEPRLTL